MDKMSGRASGLFRSRRERFSRCWVWGGDLPGLVIAGVGGGLLLRGSTGYCAMYDTLGVDTTRETDPEPTVSRRRRFQGAQSGVEVTNSVTIDKPVEELYAFWRNLDNLPRIMSHLESVTQQGDRHSHWVATAPALIGGSVEWDAEMVEDRPNERISWRSLPEADVVNEGSVEFKRALGDRGTIVRVALSYQPPAGKVGRWIAKLFGEEPQQQVREDMRKFKQMMEVGEVATTEGQSRGTCGAR